jgi:hypothetical protein
MPAKAGIHDFACLRPHFICLVMPAKAGIHDFLTPNHP